MTDEQTQTLIELAQLLREAPLPQIETKPVPLLSTASVELIETTQAH